MDKVNKQELRRLAEAAKDLDWAFDWMDKRAHALRNEANPAAILSLLDELDRLEANHNQLNHGVAVAATSEWNRLAEENDQLRAELEQYRKDAERYKAAISTGLFIEVDKEEVDAHLDAAMAKEGGANG